MNNNQNQIEKKKRFRKSIYTKEELRQHKTDYMLSRPWYCDICFNDKNYTLAGKTCHINTPLHYENRIFRKFENYHKLHPKFSF